MVGSTELVEIACIDCDWSGPKSDGRFVDFSNWVWDEDDPCLSQGKDNGLWECPVCEGPCIDLTEDSGNAIQE